MEVVSSTPACAKLLQAHICAWRNSCWEKRTVGLQVGGPERVLLEVHGKGVWRLDRLRCFFFQANHLFEKSACGSETR